MAKIRQWVDKFITWLYRLIDVIFGINSDFDNVIDEYEENPLTKEEIAKLAKMDKFEVIEFLENKYGTLR